MSVTSTSSKQKVEYSKSITLKTIKVDHPGCLLDKLVFVIRILVMDQDSVGHKTNYKQRKIV